MCGDTLDPEVKQSKLAEIAKDILCSENKPARPTLMRPPQVLSPADFPALVPTTPSSVSENNPTSLEVDTDTSLNRPAVKSNASVDRGISYPYGAESKKNLSSLVSNHSNGKSAREKQSRGEAYSRKGEDFWPKVGDPISAELRGIGVIGEQRGRSKAGSSLSPRYRDDESESRSRSSDGSQRGITPMGHMSLHDSWAKKENSLDADLSSFPSLHGPQQNVKTDLMTKNSALQRSFDSLDDIDDDIDDELDINLEMTKKHRHSSGPSLHAQQSAIGQSILSGALMLSDYSGPSRVENDSSLSDSSPVDNDQMVGRVDGRGESDNSFPGRGMSSYSNRTPGKGIWPMDKNSNAGSGQDPSHLSGGRDQFRSPTVETESPARSSPGLASRYSFAKTSPGDNNLDKQSDLVEFDDIQNLLKSYQENYSDENSKKGGSAANKGVIGKSDSEMKLPILSFELSAEAKEFIPRPKKEDAPDNADVSPPKFLMPKMLSQERPLPTSPPRMPLIPPGVHRPRPPFAMPLPHWPPPPLGARLPFPAPIGRPPPPPHFPAFHDPNLRGPYATMLMRPGQIPPPRKPPSRPSSADKGSRVALTPEVLKVKEKVNGGTKCLILMRGLPGSGKSTLAR